MKHLKELLVQLSYVSLSLLIMDIWQLSWTCCKSSITTQSPDVEAWSICLNISSVSYIETISLWIFLFLKHAFR